MRRVYWADETGANLETIYRFESNDDFRVTKKRNYIVIAIIIMILIPVTMFFLNKLK
jgi:hypothetical protein